MPLRHSVPNRRHALLGLASMALATAVPAARAQPVQAWRGAVPAPWTGADLQGRAWTIPAPGQAMVVNFWASWCEPCRTEMPSLQQLADFYGDRLAVLGVNFKERRASIERFARNGGFSMPMLPDPEGELARRWQVKVFPSTLLIGADGKPRTRVQGELDWSGAEAGRLVEALWR